MDGWAERGISGHVWLITGKEIEHRYRYIETIIESWNRRNLK